MIINNIGEVKGNLFYRFNETHETAFEAIKKEQQNRAALGLPIQADYEIGSRIDAVHEELQRTKVLGDKYQHLAASKLSGLTAEELQAFVTEQEKEAVPNENEIEEGDWQMKS